MANIVSFLKLPNQIKKFEDFPDGFDPREILGTVEEVLDMVQAFYPELTINDLIITENPVRSFSTRWHSDEMISKFYQEYGWRAVDIGNAEILPHVSEKEE